MPPSSVELLLRWRDSGDEQAVSEFLSRYLHRLLGLLRQRMSRKLQRRLDPEDLAQSACHSFCLRIRDGRIDIEDNDDPWALLAKIAVRKLFSSFAFHQGAGKRSLDREDSLAGAAEDEPVTVEKPDPEPTPDELAAIEEERELLLKDFRPLHRQMVELRLDGHQVQEIAALTGRTERTVSDVLNLFRERLLRRAEQFDRP